MSPQVDAIAAKLLTDRKGLVMRDLSRVVPGLVGVAVVALVAPAPLSAQAQTPPPGAAVAFTHWAKGGELRGGRLTLRGVGRRVTWADTRGGSGTVSIRRLQRLLFEPGQQATGILHMAGSRAGHEPTFMLSGPRSNPARRTVRYRAKPLNNKPLRGQGARAAGILRSRKFGAASLTIVRQDNPSCTTAVENGTGHNLTLVSASTAPDNQWFGPPPASIPAADEGGWSTANTSGTTIGCSNAVVYQINDPVHPSVQVTFQQSAVDASGSNTCVSSDPAYECNAQRLEPGVAQWSLVPAQP
jgi:hypothetical protein